MTINSVEIKISNDEALVLFEFLSRFSNTDKITIEHQAEEIVLWNLTCNLEKLLPEPFFENYSEVLRAAKERLCEQS